MLSNYLLHIRIWVKDIKNKSGANTYGRKEITEGIMVDMKWIDLIIRCQEPMERKNSNDGFLPRQQKNVSDAINSEKSQWDIMDGSGQCIFGFGLE